MLTRGQKKKQYYSSTEEMEVRSEEEEDKLVQQKQPREDRPEDDGLDSPEEVDDLMDHQDFGMSEDEESDLNVTTNSIQIEKIDRSDIQSSNCIESRLRSKVGKPVEYWKNEKPVPNQPRIVKPVQPVGTEKRQQLPKVKRRKLNVSKESRKVENDGICTVVNQFEKEENVKIYGTPQTSQVSHLTFSKVESIPIRYDTISTDQDKAQLSVYTILKEKGVIVGTLVLKPGVFKPNANASRYSKVFHILKGEVACVVNTNPLIHMKPGSVIHILPFNSYYLHNIGKGDCKIFYSYVYTERTSQEEPQEEEYQHDPIEGSLHC